MEKKLKPCPFCGSNKVRLFQKEYCVVYCDFCEARGASKFSEYLEPMRTQAIEAWNTRAKERHDE